MSLKRKRSEHCVSATVRPHSLSPTPRSKYHGHLRHVTRSIDLQPCTLESSPPVPAPEHQLTEGNLSRHDKIVGAKGSTAAHSSSAVSRNSAQLLELHRIHVDRACQQPSKVSDLVTIVTKKRAGDSSPKSRKIKDLNLKTSKMVELDAQRALDHLLGYIGEQEDVDGMGEKNIKRSIRRLFASEVVPLAVSAQEELQECFNRLDSPSTPRPDISYGYTTTAFNEQESAILTSLPASASAFQDEPWFPYWLVEWKGRDGDMYEAITQARRNGASAVNAFCNLYKLSGLPHDAADTACFTACIDSYTCMLRIHWRNDTDPDNIHFEGQLIGSCLLHDEEGVYKIRSYILNILKWARDTRLPNIQRALRAVHAQK